VVKQLAERLQDNREEHQWHREVMDDGDAYTQELSARVKQGLPEA
jgi:hypothetical protein